MTVRVVFFGNSASVFTARHFQALLRTSCVLCGVVDVPAEKRGTTNPLSSGLPDFVRIAQERSIQAFCPVKTDDPSFIGGVRELEPDLFLTVGYALILKEAALQIPRLLAANFHASILPDYRGKHPVFWALRAGERWAGLTVHALDAGIDTGDILYQVKVRTRRSDRVSTLYDRIMDHSTRLVGKLIADVDHGSIPRRPQENRSGSYFSSPREEDFRLVWSWDAERIRRMVTLTPGECFIQLGSHQLYFMDAEYFQVEKDAAPGTLLRLGRKRAVIKTGDKAVSFAKLRIDSSNTVIPASQLLQELGLKSGDVLK
jgi:methionyl-tRNA formyltransferase